MRFVDFLKATVLACAAAATALAAASVAAAAADQDIGLLAFAAAWWTVAAGIGIVLGRRGETTPPIARLLAGARASSSLPDQQSATRVLLNRLWPLLVVLLLSAALALVTPQVPAIAAGFAVIWSLSWRKQDAAVTAIEERDGVAFYLERTSPFRPIQLVRTPGFRRVAPPALPDPV